MSAIDEAARRHGVDPALLRGCCGAGDLDVDVDGAARVLAQDLLAFGGDERKAVAAFHVGPGAVAEYGGVPPYPDTERYVREVLAVVRAHRDSSLAGLRP